MIQTYQFGIFAKRFKSADLTKCGQGTKAAVQQVPFQHEQAERSRKGSRKRCCIPDFRTPDSYFYFSNLKFNKSLLFVDTRTRSCSALFVGAKGRSRARRAASACRVVATIGPVVSPAGRQARLGADNVRVAQCRGPKKHRSAESLQTRGDVLPQPHHRWEPGGCERDRRLQVHQGQAGLST